MDVVVGHLRGILLQVEDILTEVQRKEEENRQLQEEMDAARQRFTHILPFLIQLLPLWKTQEEEHFTFNYNVTFQARGSQQSSHGGVDYPKPSSS